MLHGVSPAEAQRVGAATERELSRLLAERGVPGQLVQGAVTDVAVTDVMDAGAFARAPWATPEVIGGEIARAVHGGLGR